MYVREVAKEALRLNAAKIIVTHNHPSGSCKPSIYDEIMTGRLVGALSLFDIAVVDHIIVSQTGAASFKNGGLL